jgi:hypothetical protein
MTIKLEAKNTTGNDKPDEKRYVDELQSDHFSVMLEVLFLFPWGGADEALQNASGNGSAFFHK